MVGKRVNLPLWAWVAENRHITLIVTEYKEMITSPDCYINGIIGQMWLEMGASQQMTGKKGTARIDYIVGADLEVVEHTIAHELSHFSVLPAEDRVYRTIQDLTDEEVERYTKNGTYLTDSYMRYETEQVVWNKAHELYQAVTGRPITAKLEEHAAICLETYFNGAIDTPWGTWE